MVAPLHIVLLNYRDITHPEAGGAEIYLQEIFGRIAAHGHRVTLLCAKHGAAPAEERIGQIRVLRVSGQAVVNVAAAVAALRMARRERVDVFVESLCKLPFLLPAVTSIPVLPVVLHLFGDAVFRETNLALGAYVWLFERLIPPVYRGLRFVALSDSTARDLISRGVRANRIDVIPPGLDLHSYPTNGSLPCTAGPLLVYVGRLKRYKGLDTVIRAFGRVCAAVSGAQLVLVGKGDDRPRLEKLVRALGLTASIHFTGFVPEAEKIDWLRRARAVVYPSPREGWGIATLEAAACGTPVVASDAEGLRDAVRDGSTGFLVPHADVDAWAQRMTQLLTDASVHHRMRAAARQWAQQFDWDVEAAKMRQIVEEVAAAGRAPHMR